ncbi:MAG: hypothetical protein ACSLE7_10230 [Mycobacterium sp.]|jgi:hypothetical protein
MKGKRSAPVRGTDEYRRGTQQSARTRQTDAPPRKRRTAPEQRPQRSAPKTTPIRRPADGPARPKNASQAKARAKARKAKAPKVVRLPLRERLIARLACIEFNPRTLAARVPFVVLIIGALGLGLGVTLWLSTDAAERSYQLGNSRQLNQALLQQKEALERDVLEAQAPPALAESARELGMIPSRDTAHLVQDPTGAWMVVGTPKPAEGVPPPPLNSPLPDERAAAPARPATDGPPAPRVVDPREVVVRIPPRALPPAAATPWTAPVTPVTPVAPLAVPVDPGPAAVPGPIDQLPAPLPPQPAPSDGLPHLASPALPAVPAIPALPGPVGGPEYVAPAPSVLPEIPGAPA